MVIPTCSDGYSVVDGSVAGAVVVAFSAGTAMTTAVSSMGLADAGRLEAAMVDSSFNEDSGHGSLPFSLLVVSHQPVPSP